MVYERNFKNNKGSLRFACDDMNLIPVNPALKVHIPKYDTAPSDPGSYIYQRRNK